MRARAASKLCAFAAGSSWSCSIAAPSTSLPRFLSIDSLKHNQFSTATPPGPLNILSSLHGAEFQHQLDQLRQQSRVLPFHKFLEEFRRSVPSASEEDAARVMEALAASGSILRHGNLVYTRPNEIADALRRVLPIDVSSVKEALQRVEGDLSGLEAERSSIIGRARLRSKMVNYVFFTALAMQWGLLFRLTYWELSWDVIEPVGFFVGGFSSLASFGWFLKTRQDFTYEAMHKRTMTNYERKAFSDAQFNIVEYNRLTNEAENLREVMAAHEGQQKGS